ncbi:phosphodiester glycosidase family protein [bacterium]|nr:phosphodiester glycosidase family protein [candidate division CSSED10-310 bacterium]
MMLISIILGMLIGLEGCCQAADTHLREIDKGLWTGEYHAGAGGSGAPLRVVRIDPGIFEFRLLCSSELGTSRRPVREWRREHGLTGAVNAGMYLTDYLTNVGYMKNGAYLNNARINPKYQSVAAFSPVDQTAPPFRIFDTDVTPAREIIARYEIVIQNLRLIKRPGKNRWSMQEKRWSEAALAEDGDGMALLIFAGEPLSMYEFNEVLLGLPLGIVAAQHLEGGADASLSVVHGGFVLDLCGGVGTAGAVASGSCRSVPNVLGFVRRPPSGE